VYDASDLFADPQVAALGAIAHVDGIPMSNVMARLSETPGRIRWAGREHGADTAEVLAEIGVDGARLAELRTAGAV
jgi:crotonobetainyl-CoA:carnitine CoA-transferase CaiB-like acyl-CoA transferase